MKTNPFVSWGNVELWRILHGELPKSDDMKPLDYAAALNVAGNEVMSGKVSPFNAGTMLYAAAKKIQELQEACAVINKFDLSNLGNFWMGTIPKEPNLEEIKKLTGKLLENVESDPLEIDKTTVTVIRERTSNDKEFILYYVTVFKNPDSENIVGRMIKILGTPDYCHSDRIPVSEWAKIKYGPQWEGKSE